MLAIVIVEVPKDGSEERWLELPADQGYETACVPARINE
jgi:hypothetical protein